MLKESFLQSIKAKRNKKDKKLIGKVHEESKNTEHATQGDMNNMKGKKGKEQDLNKERNDTIRKGKEKLDEKDIRNEKQEDKI